MHANGSPIHSLQQLKDLLDAGALTRQEFELLKRKLISSLLGDDANPAPENTLTINSAQEADEDEALLPLTSYELVEEPQPESDPSFGDLPPRLEVDHLLAQAEKNPALRHEEELANSRSQGSGLESFSESASSVVFEPGNGENADEYSSSQEEEPQSGLFGGGNLLNAMLVASILSLAVFGGYIYVNQQKWESEQIISRGTQRTGGLAPASEQAEFSSTTSSFAEGTVGGEKAPVAKQTVTEPASTPRPDQERAGAEPVAPAEAPASETAKPAATPSEPKNEPTPGKASDPTEDEPERTPVSPKRASPHPQESSGGEEGIETTEGDGTSLMPAGEAEQGIINQIGNRLRRYYVDYQAKPFGAKDHFAPKVDRYFTLTRVTPAAISQNLERNRNEEIQEGRYSFDPSSIRLVKQGKGGYEVLFVEYGQAILKSTQQKQETAVWIRARFDKNFRITYFQEERPVREGVADL